MWFHPFLPLGYVNVGKDGPHCQGKKAEPLILEVKVVVPTSTEASARPHATKVVLSRML